MGTFDIVFWIGWLATELKKDGMPMSHFGYAYGAISFFYLVFCLIYAVLEHKIPRKLAMAMGHIGCGISFLILGPSLMFNFIPHSLTFKLVALMLLGVFQVTFFIPIIPEMIESLIVENEI